METKQKKKLHTIIEFQDTPRPNSFRVSKSHHPSTPTCKLFSLVVAKTHSKLAICPGFFLRSSSLSLSLYPTSQAKYSFLI